MCTKLMIINGSLNQNSVTKKVLKIIEKKMYEKGYEIIFINIGDLNLPIFDPNLEKNHFILDIEMKLSESSAFIIGSPEYHSSYSGALKNFLDYLDYTSFKDKPTALISSAGGFKAGINTLNHLRTTLRSLYADVIPYQLAVSQKELKNDMLYNIILDNIENIINYLDKKLKNYPSLIQ